MLPLLENIPTKEILIVIYGGIFGWTLGKLPKHWVYGVLAGAILFTIVLVL